MSITKLKFLSLQKKTRQKRDEMREENQKLKKNIAELSALKTDLKNEQAKGNSANSSTINSITIKANKLRDKNTKARKIIIDIEAEISIAVDDLIFSTDPRDQVAMLDDSYPIFLAPVRVETRFVTVKHIARIERDKIPSGINPNVTVVNGHPVAKPLNLSVNTVINGVQEVPVIDDVQELWIRIFPDDIAVHTHEKELTEIEIKAAQTFWKHIWHAADDGSLRLGAWRGIVSSRGPERAAWIARQMEPLNPDDKPAVVIDAVDDLPVEPVFPETTIRESTWSQPPQSRIMPDRFVVRLYIGSSYREVIGENIPDPLHLGIDPKALENEIENEDGVLVLKDKLKWMQDFDEAEKVGMGIRVPLFPREGFFQSGFDKILVLGVKTSADKDEGKELLEDLLNNHHYTHGGLSVVPQGTPTNNTEGSDSGYSAYNANEEDLFNIELGEPLFTPTSTDMNKTDGQQLADALGISYEAVQNIKHADQTDIKEAMCMNKALWPTTFGYYLPQMMHPVFSEAEIERTKRHFNQYVLGRGRIPAIRVDDQPYGILPVTAFSKWTYNTNSSNDKFLGKMHDNVLKRMDIAWQNLSQKVKVADSTTNQGSVEKLFLDVLGLHASSVEFYQRYVTGPYLLWNIYNYSSIINGATGNPTNASYASSLDFFQLFGDQNFLYVFPPRLFNFFYSQDHKFLNGPVIDTIGLSEERKLSALGANGENYIDWLIKSNWAQIKNEDLSTIGAPDTVPPSSLLYLMLRHAAMLEYNRTGLTLLADNGLVSELALFDTEFNNISTVNGINPELRNIVMASTAFKEGVKADKQLEKKVEKEFIRRADAGEFDGMDISTIRTARSEFKRVLAKDERPKIIAKANLAADKVLEAKEFTSNKAELLSGPQAFLEGLSVADYIDRDLLKPEGESQFSNMHELIENLKCLKDLPTARLERCFAEHIDLANYRLDAWFYSLVLERLQKLRKTGSNRNEGVYIGGYAWLENLCKGEFEAIHYREVDIKPERILVPDISTVAIADGLNMNAKVSGIRSAEFIKNRNKINQPAAPIVNSDTVPSTLGVSMFMISNIAGTEAASGNQGFMATGGNTLSLNAIRKDIRIADPLLLDVPVIKNLGPAYTYLGNDDVGPITYDLLTDRFINAPRVDPANQGYIHAPSINHATTAAILRAGYESHRLNPGSPDDTLAININSERVRKALYYLEGVDSGQELGALLGYQFERGLHDRGLHDEEIGLDAYILEIRLKYPFVAGRVTDSTGIANVESAEAYNVVNGLELLENSENPVTDYPYGIVSIDGEGGLPIFGSEKNAIIAEVEKLHDAMDGINDLLMSEAMHQVVLGNYPKASAVLSAMRGKPLAIDPDVVKTPRNFDVLNHRVGCHFDLSPNGHKIWTSNGTARSLAEPHLNRWLSSVLPDPGKIQVNYQYQFFATDGTPGAIHKERLGLDELNIEAIDLYYILSLSTEEGNASAMLNRLNYHARKNVITADNVKINVAFADRDGLTDDQITLLELQALIDQLHQVVGNSRPLRPLDFMLSDGIEDVVEANPTLGLDSSMLLNRLEGVFGDDMSNGQRGFKGTITDLMASIVTAETITEDPITAAGNKLDGIRAALDQADFFGVQNAAPATASDVSFEISTALLVSANAVLKEMEERKDKAETQLNEVATTSKEEIKIKRLEEAAKEIFGRSFKVFPEYQLYNEGQINAANSYADYLEHAGEHAIEEWFQGLSPVRKRIHALHQTGLLAKAIGGNNRVLDLSLSQIPLEPIDPSSNPVTRWLGVEFPKDYEAPDENISMLFFNPIGYSPSGLQTGIMADEWVEELPGEIAHTGVSIHFNNPNSEPPQTCLLAVSPNLDGKWSWDDLMDTLSETLDWAKKRAVDPDIMNDSIYPQVLPAVYAAISASDDTPTLDFGRNVIKKPNNGVFGMIKVQDYNTK